MPTPGLNSTPLDELFMFAPRLEAHHTAKAWLSILSSEGYDVVQYLSKEADLHVAGNYLTHVEYDTRAQRQLIFGFGAHPGVYWDWWFDPGSSTLVLLREFTLMNMSSPDSTCLSWNEEWQTTWPVLEPGWMSISRLVPDEVCWPRWQQLIRRVCERTEKSIRKRRRKLTRLKKLRDCTQIPGSWPSEADHPSTATLENPFRYPRMDFIGPVWRLQFRN